MAGRGPIVERVGVVVGVRGGDDGPRAVVETRGRRAGGVVFDEAPVGIEIEREAFRGVERRGEKREGDDDEAERARGVEANQAVSLRAARAGARAGACLCR